MCKTLNFHAKIRYFPISIYLIIRIIRHTNPDNSLFLIFCCKSINRTDWKKDAAAQYYNDTPLQYWFIHFYPFTWHCNYSNFAFFYYTVSKYPMIPMYPSFFKGDHNVCNFILYIWLLLSTVAFIVADISLFCTDVWCNKTRIHWTSSLHSFLQ